MGRLDEFYAQHPEHRPFAPVKALAGGREAYVRSTGLGDVPRLNTRQFQQVEALPENTKAIGAAYDRLPTFDQSAVPSFRGFREETKRQFDFLTGSRGRGRGLGFDVEVSRQDPYANPAALRADLEQGRMKVLSTKETGGHPFLNDDENDMFRAVHDAFGHAATGRGFDRHGEEAAWLSHSRMYSPLARRAMTSETRGQNSSFISAGGVFPEQKVALLPSAVSDVPKAIGRRGRLLNPGQFND